REVLFLFVHLSCRTRARSSVTHRNECAVRQRFGEYATPVAVPDPPGERPERNEDSPARGLARTERYRIDPFQLPCPREARARREGGTHPQRYGQQQDSEKTE